MRNSNSFVAAAGFLVSLAYLVCAVPAGAGELIPVPSDRNATYEALEFSPRKDGAVVVMTQRDAPNGRLYTFRECDCADSKYRVLGEGDSIEKARQRFPADGITTLMEGSVSYHVCAFACAPTRLR